ncbi:hypothetical protein [Pseudoalteromonas rubra]|uniref:Uncharacterized protein n=1 Tax=Pseudoalteromonas rubra TaxID=43658 RepID=A0A5S3WZ65_9GAMM|nr:hypothetical protein [Pseudoalteromonas rubra]TMP35873.1 hypothetical protein CWB98_15610 [Pseudoalteromonas rubra]
MKLSIMLQIVAVLLSVISLIVTFRARKGTIKTSSKLTLVEGKPIAAIRALKKGQKRLVIQSIRLSIHTWDYAPKLVNSGLPKVLNVIEDVFCPEYHFVSDDAIQYSIENKQMEEGDELCAYVDLDAMMESFINSGETMHSKFFFELVIFTLKVEVYCTDGNSFKVSAHRDIKSYLRNKYLNDERFY